MVVIAVVAVLAVVVGVAAVVAIAVVVVVVKALIRVAVLARATLVAAIIRFTTTSTKRFYASKRVLQKRDAEGNKLQESTGARAY